MFYPIYIDQCATFGFSGGPGFSTNIQNLQSGREKRNGDWAVCRHKFDVPFANLDADQYQVVKTMFLIMRGKLHTFLYTDPADNQAVDAAFGPGDGATTVFQLRKESRVGAAAYERQVTKPHDGLAFKVAGVTTAATYDRASGLVTFASAPPSGADLRWTGGFDVQVRFDIDDLPFSLDNANASGLISNGSITLIEVLDE